MRNFSFLTALLLTLAGPATAQQYGAQRLIADGQAYAYPTVVYSQSVVSNTSTAFNNVVNLHWKRGAGTGYVVLAGRYLQRSPYDGIFPTPTPPFAPAPTGQGNGVMDADSRLPAYPASYEVAPYLIKTGDYNANPADTTAQILNARPGETYYAYIWEYTQPNGLVRVLSPPPASNLSWQSLFTQFHAPPRIISVTLDALRRPVITWTTATEDSVAGFRILTATDGAAVNGTLSGAGRTQLLSTETPTGYSQSVSTYSQTLPNPVAGNTWFQVTQFLTNKSTFVTNEPFWSNIMSIQAPLPVTLVSFTAQRRSTAHAAVKLTWATATELNNQGFRVERSLDATRWSQVAFVAGAGNRTGLSTYLTLDSCRTAAYYRLAQVDFDGNTTYGPVRYVTAASEGLTARLSLFPTLATNSVNVLNADPTQELTVLNVVGQQLHTLPAGTQRFDVSSWPRGMYFVRQTGQLAKLILE